MTFNTVSFGYGIKREGRRLSHLVIDGRKTVCGRIVGNPGALWAFSDAQFIPSTHMVSTPQSQRECIEHHITCKSCLKGKA
jgi:hypothetical protein